MKFVRLFFAYVLATPFLVAGVVFVVFIGTVWLGVLCLFLTGLIGAWGWWPFIPTGRALHDKERNKYGAAKDANEGEYPCRDIEGL